MYKSKLFNIEVRNEITKEFTDVTGKVDDMLAGLHEIRVRIAEKKYDITKLTKKIEKKLITNKKNS